ncbi:T-complex protein 1 subunit delta [Balamuthia mandrillaris]
MQAATSSAGSSKGAVPSHGSNKQFKDGEKEKDVRASNIAAAKAVADTVRTSLGPKGMDKMIVSSSGDVIISNDGATILDKLEVIHPAAKMMVELSKSQDAEAGDGTTSVVVIAGALLGAAQTLLNKGIHPTTIAESFLLAKQKAVEIMKDMSTPVELTDRESLLKSAITALNSKVVSQYSNLLAPLAVNAVLQVIDPKTATNVDLRDIKIVSKLGGLIDDTELVDGLVFTQKAVKSAGGPSMVENAKIGLIQFQLSPPKTNMDNSVFIEDYTQMDRILREERKYLLDMCNKIKKTGCNVLLIQKSILRDAVSDLSLHFLAKLKILVVKDVEREDIEFICRTLGCKPIASIEGFVADKLGSAKLVEEVSTSGGSLVKITGVPNPGKTVTVVVRGSNQLVIDEAERSLHDALCVIRSLVKQKFLIAGGGAPEIEVSLQLGEWAKTLQGKHGYCVRAFAESLEIVPYTLAENAGLHPIAIVTNLRNRHAQGEKTAGINVRKGIISNILEENVVQPLLVSTSCISLATENTVAMLKIDDIVACK